MATAQRWGIGALLAITNGTMSPIWLVLVDDHVVLRTGLRALLEKEPDFVVVGEAGTGSEAIRWCGQRSLASY